MATVSGASVRWQFTVNNGPVSSDTGPSPNGGARDLYYVTQVDVYDLTAGDSVSLSVDKTSMSENGGTATVKATRSAPSASATDVTIDILPISGADATIGSDFTQSGSVAWEAGMTMRNVYTFQIPAGQLYGYWTLASINDTAVEPDETITFKILRVSSAVIAPSSPTLVVHIDDDDRLVTLGVNNNSISETGGSATVTAYLSEANAANDVTVSLGFSGTAATAPIPDYTRSATSVTIPKGQTSSPPVTITAVGDTTSEPDETVIVDITGVTNAKESGTEQQTITIVDDDMPQVSLELAGSPLAENNTGVATVTARLTAVSWQPVTVNLGFSGTATIGTDYTRSAASITIPAGSLTGSVTITGVADTLDEPDETVIVDVTGIVGALAGPTQQVTATITDDDAPPTVTLSHAPASLAENGGVTTVTATLSAASSYDVTVDLGFAGSATDAADYTASAASILIPAGSLSGTMTLTGVDDALDEPDETVIVDVTGVTNGTESGTQQVTATITDDDPTPTVTLTLEGSPFAEAAGVATVRATLSAASGYLVSVDLAFTGTAANTTDYTRSGATISIPRGSLSGTVVLTAVQDTIDEPDETVIVDVTNITNATAGGAQQVTATITDDDVSTVTLGLSGSPFAEAGGVATVTATLSTPSTNATTVHLAFGGTAAPADYTASAATITIPAGSTSGSMTLTGNTDALYELEETVIVDITTVDGGAVEDTSAGQQQVTARITDDDVPPNVTLSLAGSPFAENGGAATIKAVLSAPAGLPVTVAIGLSGTATPGNDYTTTPATPIALVITPGATEATLTLTGVDDALDEADETVIIDIDGVTNGVESGTQQVTATITDDDLPPTVTLSVGGTPMLESGGTATVTALLSGPSGLPVTVNLGFGGSATYIDDYTRSATAITIPAGSSSGAVTLNATNDALDELDETVTIDITGATNATPAGTQQVATITDDDPPPTVTLALAGSPLAETGGVATIRAILSSPSTLPVTVNLGLTGTATYPDDYTTSPAVPIALLIPAGATEATLTLSAAADLIDEIDETVIVDITGTTNAVESGTQQVTATIVDDDTAAVTLALSGSPFNEAGGVATVTATLSTPSTSIVTVNLGFGGTAAATDYTASAASVTIPAGATSGSITLTGNDDALYELNETVVVDITTVTGGAVEDTSAGQQQVIATITDDDVPPSVTLSLSGTPLAESGGSATVKALLGSPSGLPVTVMLGLTGTATELADYIATPPAPIALIIPAGATEASLTLTAVADAIDEADETVIIDITGVTNGIESGTQQVTATISDENAPPTVTLSLAGSPLAESGGVATVRALLSTASGLPVTVNLGLSGTAANGIDYTTTPTTLVIPAGSTEGTLTVTALPDTLDEVDESVIVDIASVTNGIESGTQQVTATIVDDDLPPTVTLSLAGSPAIEAGGVVMVKAVLSGPSGLPVAVTFGLTGTATNPDDYTTAPAAPPIVIIPAGATEGTLTLTAVDDAVDEADETIIVDITGVTNGVESGTQQVTATITDDDAPPTVTLSVANTPFAENGGVATVTALLSGPSALPVTANLAFGGTATNVADYSRSAESITIPAGTLSGAVVLSAVDDPIDELDETVIVDISGVTNGTESGVQQVTATIIDDDAPPAVTLSLTGSPLAETGGAAQVKATLSGPSALPVIVNLSLGGTATYASDYATNPAAPIALTIPAGATEATLALTTVPDAIDEVDETVVVDIASVTNGIESGTQQVTATIVDDDLASVRLALSGSPMSEAGGVATVTATLSTPSSTPVVVHLGFSGTASAADYAASATSITIPAGSTSGSMTITSIDDAVHELDETVIVDITSVDGAIEDVSAGEQRVTATITDEDVANVTLAIAGSPMKEAGGVATVTATLSRLSSQDVTVGLSLSGTAATGDYTASAPTIVIAAGSTTGSMTLTAVDDAVAEFDETIVVDITATTNAVESGTQQVTATITDDDPVRLEFVTQPSTTIAGHAITPAVIVRVLDKSDRLLVTSTARVTLAIGVNPAAGTLSGASAVAAVGGRATFADLAIDAYGAGYTLIATSSNLTRAISNAFEITPDAVTTFSGPTATGTGVESVSFTGGGAPCTFTQASLIGQPPGTSPVPPTMPAGLVFPHGMLSFEISGCTAGATVTFVVTYPEALPEGTRYWKYGSRTAGGDPVWYELPATINGNQVTFTIVDGGVGDADGLPNGTIRDPGGPAFIVTGIPATSEWMLWLIAAMLLGIGLLRMRSSGM